jgi:hypothetical protein
MKKIIITIIILGVNLSLCLAKDYFYTVEQNDQLGTILLSLGHRKLWPKDGMVNQFKKSSSLKKPNNIYEGSILKIQDNDILFKKNINLLQDNITLKKKIKTLPEFDELLKNEELVNEKYSEVTPPNIEILQNVDEKKQTEEKKAVTQSFNFYPGLGGFTATNQETDRGVITSTFSGLQPMIQLKGIYSNDLFGSLSFDLLTKKIISSTFSFPLNIDYRLQYVPIWNISDSVKLAISHSVLHHSYVGKNSNVEVPYELKSNFIGLGIVIPRDNFWFELYVEKAYSGNTKSNEVAQSADKGIRIDSEIVYSIYKEWRLMPGINYYQLNDIAPDYKFQAFEARLVISHEFEF